MTTSTGTESDLEVKLDEFAGLAEDIGKLYQRNQDKLDNLSPGYAEADIPDLASSSYRDKVFEYNLDMVTGLEKLGLDEEDYVLKSEGAEILKHKLRREFGGTFYQLDMAEAHNGIWNLKIKSWWKWFPVVFGLADRYETDKLARKTFQQTHL